MGMKVEYKKNKRLNTHNYKEGAVWVGFFEDSKYADDTYVAQVARWNEYGTGGSHGIPARPFMRPAVFESKTELNAFLRSKYKKALKDNKNTMGVLKEFGEMVVDIIQRRIESTVSPANAPITINGGWLGRKGKKPVYIEGKQGKSHPLIDTGIMRDSVKYNVKEVEK